MLRGSGTRRCSPTGLRRPLRTVEESARRNKVMAVAVLRRWQWRVVCWLLRCLLTGFCVFPCPVSFSPEQSFVVRLFSRVSFSFSRLQLADIPCTCVRSL
eukprot:13720204-Heterocapsa_arctica.AAC.1